MGCLARYARYEMPMTTTMTPKELMDAFPVGSPIELSQHARAKVALIQELSVALPFVKSRIFDKLKDPTEEDRNDEAAYKRRLAAEEAVADECWREDPFKASVAEHLNPRSNNSFHLMGHFATTANMIVWAIVRADLVRDGLPREMFPSFRLSLQANATVVVTGYAFTDDQLGLKAEAQSLEPPPANPDDLE